MLEKSNLKYCEDTLKLKESIENSFLSLGERLQKIRDERIYFPKWENFHDYCEEMKMSEGTASKLINIYQRFVVDFGFSAGEILDVGGWSNVAEFLPLAKDKQTAQEWMDKAKSLNRVDFRRELQEKKTGKRMDKCKHEDTYILKVCRTCGLKERQL